MSAHLKVIVLVIAIGFALLWLSSCTLTRAGYQSAGYKVLEVRGGVEIREYRQLLLAQTPAAFDAQGKDGSFMRLFRFIGKGNSKSESIAMTTPVLYRKAAAGEFMAFVLPADMSNSTVPTPKDPSVKVEERAAGVFAAARMRGGRSAASRDAALAEIKAALVGSGWQFEGEAEFAYYDPPWIPAIWKKNEVLWRLKR